MDPLGQSQVLPYIENLSKNGIKFCLISFEKKQDEKKIKNLKKKLGKLGIGWHRLKYFKFYPLGMVVNIFQCFLLSFYLVISKKINVIHARAYQPLFSVIFIKKIFKTKIIFDMRGFWPEELVDSKRIQEKSFYYKILKFLEKKSILHSDWIITLTPEAKKIIKQKFKVKNVEWMPTCVDENRFKNLQPINFTDKFVVVYSGSLWSFYNMQAMANFFVAIKQKIENSHFLILGNNETEKLNKLFSQKEINKKDYTILTVSPEQVSNYLSGCDIAVSFIYKTYSKKAAFPTKIAEYLMAGLPVVINSQTDFLKNLIVKNKIGVVVDNPDNCDFNKKIDELQVILQDKNIKLICKKIAQGYLNKNICIDKYMDIYKKL
jgi:glycosyltransferase involved in cell wall biosynthesis